MRTFIFLLWIFLSISSHTHAQRKSLLDSDPNVIYLADVLEKPIQLQVTREAAVFSDKDAKIRLGFLKANQTVELEGMTERAYKVRGMGRSNNGISGWVGTAAFSHAQEDFVSKLKQLYDRQISVNQFIAEKAIAIGMTMSEVSKSRGKPTKTCLRRTSEGESGSWVYIDYDEVKHYITRIDPASGQAFRQLSHITQEEKGKTVVEFTNNIVTALEESENSGSENVRIIIAPLVYGW